MANISKYVSKDGKVSFRIRIFVGEDETRKKMSKLFTYHATATAPRAAEKEARQYADELERNIKEGLIDTNTLTFAGMVDLWREGWLPQKTVAVQEAYEAALRNHVLPSLGRMKLGRIRAVHVDAIMRELQQSGRSPQTQRYILAVIRSVFNYATRKNILKENPCDRCDDLPGIKKDEKLHYFSVDQARRFLDALDNGYDTTHHAHHRRVAATGLEYDVPEYKEHHSIPFQWSVYFRCALFGGFRRGELVALRWSDVDFEKKLITIDKAMSRTKAGQIEKGPKTQAGRRVVALPEECFERLAKWKFEQQQLSVALGSMWQGQRGRAYNENHVFIQLDNGLPVALETPGDIFHKVIDRYNEACDNPDDRLPVIRLHDLRHSTATVLLANGVDVVTVSHRLGHSRPSVTSDIYAHAMREADRTASDKLEELFGRQ